MPVPPRERVMANDDKEKKPAAAEGTARRMTEGEISRARGEDATKKVRTPLAELAAKHGVDDAVLAGVTVAYGWGENAELDDKTFTAAVKEWLARPHGAHLSRVMGLHRRTLERARAMGDEQAAQAAAAKLAELGDAGPKRLLERERANGGSETRRPWGGKK